MGVRCYNCPLMATVKVKRANGYYCFHCNATVDGDADKCPGCGRAFSEQERKNGGVPVRLGERVRLAARGQRRGYRVAIIVLLAAVVLLVILFRPGKAVAVRSVLPRPAMARPEYRVAETWDLPARDLDRLSMVALVRPGMGADGLRTVLDWTLYSVLDEHNRSGDRFLRVVWVYLLEDSTARKTDWRAMAIWVDPKLPEAQRPAGIGGDAIREGSIEYDFTNSIATPE